MHKNFTKFLDLSLKFLNAIKGQNKDQMLSKMEILILIEPTLVLKIL